MTQLLKRARTLEQKDARCAAMVAALLEIIREARTTFMPTASAVSQKAGITKATFYLYFPSMTALVVYALEAEWQRYRQEREDATERNGGWDGGWGALLASPIPALLAVLQVLTTFETTTPRLERLLDGIENSVPWVYRADSLKDQTPRPGCTLLAGLGLKWKAA